MLAIVGAVLGLGLASVALRVLTSVDPTSLPALAPVRLDLTVVAFTLLVAVVTTLVFGLAPALRTRQVDLVESLREGGQNATAGSGCAAPSWPSKWRWPSSSSSAPGR